MADGRIRTGFSLPYVAKYANSAGTIVYSEGQKLARGVDVQISPDTPSNEFYADNVLAETSNIFTSGTFNLTVDGLLASAEKLIMGLPTVGADGWTAYDDDQTNAYFGLGFVVRYQSGGVIKYNPVVLAKTAFNQIEESASTQEKEVSFQTQKISGRILRAEDAKKTWKWVGGEFTTEALAEASLKAKLGMSTT